MISMTLLAIGGVAFVAAVPTHHATSITSQEPCALISKEWAGSGLIPGVLALACLRSMPFEPKRASAFVEDLKKYMQWHSTADMLTNPPTSYSEPPFDFWEELDSIQLDAKNNKIASQFDFDTALSKFFNAVKDGHLYITPCSFTPFTLTWWDALVSVSKDGIELPDIYTYLDAQLLPKTPDLVSPVVTINNHSAPSYLESLAGSQAFQDPDARYNQMFYSWARITSPSEMSGGFFYPPSGVFIGVSNFMLGYKNGNTTTKSITAETNYNGFNYTSGSELYRDFCLPETKTSPSGTPSASPSSSPTSTPSTSATATPEPAPPGYPKAIIRDKYNLFAGYFPEQKELEDTAVMSVPTFSITDEETGTRGVSNLAVKFIEKAVASNKKRMIVDMTANRGGDTNWAIDLFKLFFPNKMPYMPTRLRTHEGLYLIEKLGFSAPDDLKETEAYEYLATMSFYDPRTSDQKHSFETLEDLYGPHEVLGSNQTTAHSFWFNSDSDNLTPIHGYGGVKNNYTSAPFAAEDILLITDGACSSSCPLFTELMSNEGVQTLSFGGRPQTGPMQSMGGTRGAQVLDAETLLTITAGARIIANATGLLSEPEIARLEEFSPSLTPTLKTAALAVNLQNAYAEHDEDSEMPLQFADQPADCRLFYTIENVAVPGSTWGDAARAIWGGGECVTGSRGEEN